MMPCLTVWCLAMGHGLCLLQPFGSNDYVAMTCACAEAAWSYDLLINEDVDLFNYRRGREEARMEVEHIERV